MQSQASDKSIKIVSRKPWLSISFSHDCHNVNNACYVLCAFRKPQKQSSVYFQQIHIVDYKLISSRPQRVEVKYYQVYSSIYQRGSSFLKTGVILAVFKQSGKLEASIDRLMQFFKISNIQPQFFKVLTGISPPASLLFFKS